MIISNARRFSIAALAGMLLICPPAQAQPSVQITSPANGAVVNPGQTVTVTVSPSGSGFSDIYVISPYPIGFGTPVAGSPNQFSLQIPISTTPKGYTLTAVGVAGGVAVSNQITILVQRADSPVSLRVQPSTLQVPVADTTYLEVWGTYSDGTVYELSQAPNIAYTSSNPSVATVGGAAALVTAVSPGVATISVNGIPSVSVTVLPPMTIAPPQKALYAGQSQQFYPRLADRSTPSVLWSLNPPGAGSISSSGLYTAPPSIASQQTVAVTTTSSSDATISATSSITLLPPFAMSLTPASVNLNPSQTAQFYASLTNTVNYGLNWSINPKVGQIGILGLYTAPASITTPQTVTVTATSTANGTTAATATVNLQPLTAATTTSAASVSVPFSASSQSVPLSATVTSAAGTVATGTVTFTILNGTAAIGAPVTLGTVTNGAASASYTLPAGTAAGTYTIQAVYNAGAGFTTSSDTAHTLTVTAPISVTVSPATAALVASRTQQFIATVSNSTNTAVTWTISPSAGSINASGLYTAPSSISSQQTVTVKAASVADPTKTATAAVTLYPPVANLSLTPSSQNLFAGGTQQFTALSGGIATSNVTWSLSPATGTVSAGLYTAPAAVPSQTSVKVTATSTIDPTKSASATVSLGPLSMSISPSSANLRSGQTQQFTASITHNPNTAVTWSVAGPGSVSRAGVYTAPSPATANTKATVTATSVADPTKSVSSTVSLQP